MRRKIYNKNVGGLMSSNIDESLSPFEQALKQFDMLQNYKEQRLEKLKEQKEETNYTRAAKGATFNDFLEMVKKVVERTMKKENVTFYPDDSVNKVFVPEKEIDHPFIFYTLLSRTPRSKNIKPRFREDITDRNANGSIARLGSAYGQFFDCSVQFNIMASDYSIADKVMNIFEDAMQKYSGFFKKNGVSELFFEKQYTDNNLDIYRKKVSIRSLVYRVSIERIQLTFDTTISEITQ